VIVKVHSYSTPLGLTHARTMVLVWGPIVGQVSPTQAVVVCGFRGSAPAVEATATGSPAPAVETTEVCCHGRRALRVVLSGVCSEVSLTFRCDGEEAVATVRPVPTGSTATSVPGAHEVLLSVNTPDLGAAVQGWESLAQQLPSAEPVRSATVLHVGGMYDLREAAGEAMLDLAEHLIRQARLGGEVSEEVVVESCFHTLARAVELQWTAPLVKRCHGGFACGHLVLWGRLQSCWDWFGRGSEGAMVAGVSSLVSLASDMQGGEDGVLEPEVASKLLICLTQACLEVHSFFHLPLRLEHDETMHWNEIPRTKLIPRTVWESEWIPRHREVVGHARSWMARMATFLETADATAVELLKLAQDTRATAEAELLALPSGGLHWTEEFRVFDESRTAVARREEDAMDAVARAQGASVMAATVPFVAWLSDTAERDRWVSSLASLPDVGDVGSWIPWEGSTLEDGWCLEVGDVLLVAIDAMGPSLSRSGVPVEAAEWAGSRPIGEGWPPAVQPRTAWVRSGDEESCWAGPYGVGCGAWERKASPPSIVRALQTLAVESFAGAAGFWWDRLRRVVSSASARCSTIVLVSNTCTVPVRGASALERSWCASTAPALSCMLDTIHSCSERRIHRAVTQPAKLWSSASGDVEPAADGTDPEAWLPDSRVLREVWEHRVASSSFRALLAGPVFGAVSDDCVWCVACVLARDGPLLVDVSCHVEGKEVPVPTQEMWRPFELPAVGEPVWLQMRVPLPGTLKLFDQLSGETTCFPLDRRECREPEWQFQDGGVTVNAFEAIGAHARAARRLEQPFRLARLKQTVEAARRQSTWWSSPPEAVSSSFSGHVVLGSSHGVWSALSDLERFHAESLRRWGVKQPEASVHFAWLDLLARDSPWREWMLQCSGALAPRGLVLVPSPRPMSPSPSWNVANLFSAALCGVSLEAGWESSQVRTVRGRGGAALVLVLGAVGPIGDLDPKSLVTQDAVDLVKDLSGSVSVALFLPSPLFVHGPRIVQETALEAATAEAKPSPSPIDQARADAWHAHLRSLPFADRVTELRDLVCSLCGASSSLTDVSSKAVFPVFIITPSILPQPVASTASCLNPESLEVDPVDKCVLFLAAGDGALESAPPGACDEDGSLVQVQTPLPFQPYSLFPLDLPLPSEPPLIRHETPQPVAVHHVSMHSGANAVNLLTPSNVVVRVGSVPGDATPSYRGKNVSVTAF
jgi:hypothetical protein